MNAKLQSQPRHQLHDQLQRYRLIPPDNQLWDGLWGGLKYHLRYMTSTILRKL